MNDKYNSILKTTKPEIQEQPQITKKHKYFKLSLFIGVIISIFIIIISYFVYYKTVLTSEGIILNDLSALKSQYAFILKDLSPNYNGEKDYTIEGVLDYQKQLYNYQISREGDSTLTTLANKNELKILKNANSSYLKDSSSDYYNEITTTNYDINSYKTLFQKLLNFNLDELTINDLNNLQAIKQMLNQLTDNYNTLLNNKYSQKIYFSENKPIVEVTLQLNKSELNNILAIMSPKLQVEDDYKINIIIKNYALSNQIKSVKIIINNKTTNKRSVVLYEDNILNYLTSTDNYHLELSKIKNVKTLKIYQNKVLYSTLTQTKTNTTTSYNYQLIDKVFTIGLVINSNSNSYTYQITKNDNDVIESTNLSLNIKKTASLEKANISLNSPQDSNIANQKLKQFLLR